MLENIQMKNVGPDAKSRSHIFLRFLVLQFHSLPRNYLLHTTYIYTHGDTECYRHTACRRRATEIENMRMLAVHCECKRRSSS